MEYLTQEEFKEMFLVAFQRIEREKEQIDKINVFPVPDQDTGTNLAKTLLGIKLAIEGKEFRDIGDFSEIVLAAALNSAHGNIGVIFTGFLAGFLPSLNRDPVDAKKLAGAFLKGLAGAKKSVQDPKEGTVLDVIESASNAFKKETEEKKTNIIHIFRTAVENSQAALIKTREKMEIFRKANVVDAGGLGFLMILESFLEALEKAVGKRTVFKEIPSGKIKKFVQVISMRYELVILIKNPKLDGEALKEKLKDLGDSIDVVSVGNKIKLHIHTDYPEEVKDLMSGTGQILEIREEDMAKEVSREESVKRSSIGIVTEDIAMLLPKIIERYKIETVAIRYDWPEEKDLAGENIYQKMRQAQKQGIKTTPKTTQAVPKQYLDAYLKQLEKFDKVLCIALSSKISGSYNSALQAREMVKEPERVFVFDSQNAAAGQALFVLRAIELIQEQRDMGEIVKELENMIPKVYFYLIFEDPKWIESLGRITKSQADWIRRMKKIRLNPIMEIRKGLLSKDGFVLAKNLSEALFKKIAKESKNMVKESQRLRAVIGHADNLAEAEKLKKMLKERLKAEVSFINIGPSVLCAAAGPGTLVAGWTAIK